MRLIDALWLAFILLVIALIVTFANISPTLEQCCLDPAIASTCDRQLYERAGSTIRRGPLCPASSVR